MNKLNYIFLVIITAFFLQRCSSSVEAENNEEKIRYEDKPVKVVKNTDLEEREYIRSSKISSIEKVSFSLNSEGKPFNSRKLSAQIYNQNGFLTETIIYNDEGKIEYKYTYDYDSNGKRIKTTRYSNGEAANYYKYDYNEFGNKIKSYRYDTDGNLEEYYVYEYDGNGNLIEEEWFSSSGVNIYNIENDYDDGKKNTSHTFDENDKLIYEYVFRYDEEGNIIEELKYDSDGIQVGIIQYIYKYY